MSMLLQNAVEEVKRGNFGIREKLRVISNKFLNHCEISAQEAIYLLLQLPLTQSSRDVIFINTSQPEKRVGILKSQSVLKTLPDDSTEVTCSGMLDRYSERPISLENITLAQFVACFDRKTTRRKSNKESIDNLDITDNNVEDVAAGTQIPLTDGSILVKRRVPKIIRSVKFNLKKDSEQYYREQLMLFHPWKEETSLQGQSSSFEEEYQKSKTEIDEHRRLFKAFSDQEGIDEIIENVNHEIIEEAVDDIAPVARQTEDDADEQRESASSILQPPDDSSHHYDVGLDIGGSTSKDDRDIVIPYKLADDDYLTLVRSLNSEQKAFFYYVMNKTKTTDQPYYILLSGGAGVGKSHVLKAIYQALIRYYDMAGKNPDEMKVSIAAPTGKAAYNVRGKTIHSLFDLPTSQSLQTYMPLGHSSRNTLRCRFAKLKVLIIDEISMVGVHMFNYMNNRLKEIFDSQKPFAGISLLLVGDLYQIKPVMDQWIFSLGSVEYGQLATNLWFDFIDMYELTTVMRQRDDAEFAHLLNRVREQRHNADDIQTLSSRLMTKLGNPNVGNFVHLFSSNDLVNDHNVNALSKIPGHTFVSEAKDYTIGNVDANVRQSVLDIAKNLKSNKTQNLETALSLKVSGQYMIVQNINTKAGLTNGATCKLMHVECANNKPILVWVSFPEPDIGTVTRNENKHLFKRNIEKSWTPIEIINRQFRVGKFKNVQVMRKQFPLKPAAAMTIHKNQGSTVPNVVISIKGRIQCHMLYVALSRVTSLQGLHLLDFNEKKIRVDDEVGKEISRLRQDRQIMVNQLPTTAPPTLAVLCHNARSLHKHIAEYRKDTRLSDADIIFIHETWASDSDPDDYYQINGFNVIQLNTHQKKPHRPYCGSIAYVREGLLIESHEFLNRNGVEGIKMKVSASDQSFSIVSLYCHPGSKVDEICEQLKCHFITPHITNVVIGVFNIDRFNHSRAMEKLENTISSLSLKCIHNKETTDYHSLIDHIYITNNKENCQSGVMESYWSDHKFVWLYC